MRRKNLRFGDEGVLYTIDVLYIDEFILSISFTNETRIHYSTDITTKSNNYFLISKIFIYKNPKSHTQYGDKLIPYIAQVTTEDDGILFLDVNSDGTYTIETNDHDLLPKKIFNVRVESVTQNVISQSLKDFVDSIRNNFQWNIPCKTLNVGKTDINIAFDVDVEFLFEKDESNKITFNFKQIKYDKDIQQYTLTNNKKETIQITPVMDTLGNLRIEYDGILYLLTYIVMKSSLDYIIRYNFTLLVAYFINKNMSNQIKVKQIKNFTEQPVPSPPKSQSEEIIYYKGRKNVTISNLSIEYGSYGDQDLPTLDNFLEYIGKVFTVYTIDVLFREDVWKFDKMLYILFKVNEIEIPITLFPREYYCIYLNEKYEYAYRIHTDKPTTGECKCLNVYKGGELEGETKENVMTILSNYTNKCFYISTSANPKGLTFKPISKIPVDTDDIALLAFFNSYMYEQICNILNQKNKI